MKNCFMSLKYICHGDKLNYKYNKNSIIFLAQNRKQKFILIFPIISEHESKYFPVYLFGKDKVHLEFNHKISNGIERTKWYKEICKINCNNKIEYVEIDYNTYAIGLLYKISPEELLELGISNL